MIWRRAGLEVQRLGTAVLLRLDGRTTLLDCPDGTGPALQGRTVHRVWLTSGRLERVSGLLGLLARTQPAEICFPLSDERGALLAEAWQRGWNGRVVLDAIQPGGTVDHEATLVRSAALSDGSPALGLRFEHQGSVVVYLPRCAADGAARRLCRGADLVVTEAGMGSLASLELSEGTELWSDTVGEA